MPIKLKTLGPEYPQGLSPTQRDDYDWLHIRSTRNKVAAPVDRTKNDLRQLEALERLIVVGWLRLIDSHVHIEGVEGPVDVYLVTEPAMRWLRAIGEPRPVVGLGDDEAFTACGAGQGAACCVYLVRARGFICGKTDPAVRREIDLCVREMTASIMPTRDYPDCQAERVEMATAKPPARPRRPPPPSRD